MKFVIILIIILSSFSCTMIQHTNNSHDVITTSDWIPTSFDDVEKWFDEQHTENWYQNIKSDYTVDTIALTNYLQ